MANDCKYSVRYYPMTSFYSLNNFKIIKILVRRNTNRDDSNNKNNNDHDDNNNKNNNSNNDNVFSKENRAYLYMQLWLVIPLNKTKS